MTQVKRILAALMAACLLTGCSIAGAPEENGTEPEYTIVAQEDLPEELLGQIETAKAQEMKFSYADADAFYIVRGYGEQPAGSSIRILRLLSTDEGILFDTELLGGDDAQTTSAYPYIVVKLLCDEQNVVFE